MATDYLFVYGTLQRRFHHPALQQVSSCLEYRGEAVVRGRLFDCGHYPGLLLDAQGGSPVYGELFRVLDEAQAFAALDAYEGCAANDPHPQEYRRVTATVSTPQGECTAWVYEYRWPCDAYPDVPGGRYG